MSMPAVSKHLRVLERAGLIARGREAQWRPVPDRGRPPQGGRGMGRAYRHVWEARLDRLDTYLQELKRTKEKRHGRKQRGK